MAKTNIKPAPLYTHEGAKAQHINAEQQLRRSVMSCLLWEKQFYEEGEDIAARIARTIPLVSPEKVAAIAVEAREQAKLRHMPLFIVREMASLKTHKHLVASTLEKVIQRADELTEFVALYWKNGKQPLSAQVKKGLAAAFLKFNEYALAKYNRGDLVKLRDVLFLTHAKPKDGEQAAIWKRLIAGELAMPDTWEVALSMGKDKKETWERLIAEDKLGGLAFLRNLRNMKDVGVSKNIIFAGLSKIKTERILPFRFISAAKHAHQWEAQIESAMLKCLEGKKRLPGKTAIVVDGSGSMFGTPVSKKSEIDRFEAATALAILASEICERCVIVVFSHTASLVPARRGFALRDALYAQAEKGGTNTQNGIMRAAHEGYDRIIVLTDGQSHQAVSNPLARTQAYMVNVASYKNGIGYDVFTHINGWSESVLDYILWDSLDRKKIMQSVDEALAGF
jgi:60 kDa SS-A/Ro ribonucleoprotein